MRHHATDSQSSADQDSYINGSTSENWAIVFNVGIAMPVYIVKHLVRGEYVFDGGEYALINANDRFLFTYDFLSTCLEGFFLQSQTTWSYLKSQFTSMASAVGELSKNRRGICQIEDWFWETITVLSLQIYDDDNFAEIFRHALLDFITLQDIDYKEGFRCRCEDSFFKNDDVCVLHYDAGCTVTTM